LELVGLLSEGLSAASTELEEAAASAVLRTLVEWWLNLLMIVWLLDWEEDCLPAVSVDSPKSLQVYKEYIVIQ